MLIDSHAHLNFKDYHKDLEQVIRRAKENGIEKIICVASNLADSERAIEIAKKYPKIVYAAVGIHPQSTDLENKESLDNQITTLTKLANNPAVIAIGECGLDFSPPSPGEKNRSKEEQEQLFRLQLKLARKLNLPVCLHSRKAFAETITIMNEFPGLSGVFHCYSAGKNEVEKVNQLGFFFGVNGNLTYDLGLQNVLKRIPLEKIVLETDCPFLAPFPFRGQRNEPSFLKITADFLAKIKNIPFSQVARATSLNTKKLFKVE